MGMCQNSSNRVGYEDEKGHNEWGARQIPDCAIKAWRLNNDFLNRGQNPATLTPSARWDSKTLVTKLEQFPHPGFPGQQADLAHVTA